MRILILEDNHTELEHLLDLVSSIQSVNVVATFNTPIHALNWLQTNIVDVIICDIELPEMTGIEFVQNLKTKTDVIFTTSHPEYALKSFDVQPLHFLAKPISYTKIINALNRVSKNLAVLEDAIFVLVNKEHVKLNYSEILRIQAEENYTRFVLKNESKMVLSSLTAVEKQLPSHHFVRVHKSHLVNFNAIDFYHSEMLSINGVIIPIGASYRVKIMELLSGKTIKRKV